MGADGSRAGGGGDGEDGGLGWKPLAPCSAVLLIIALQLLVTQLPVHPQTAS